MKIQTIRTSDDIDYVVDNSFVFSEYHHDNRYSIYNHTTRPCNIRKLKDGSFFVIDYLCMQKIRIYPAGIKLIHYV